MIAIIDYDAGNTCSVINALKRLNTDYILTSDIAELQRADKVIFPGVGHAGAAMESLRNKGLVEVIRNLTQPVLGICVGMQLMCTSSEEGDTVGLDIINTRVKRFDDSHGLKVPHMGWNKLKFVIDDPLWHLLKDSQHYYFVHSYYVPFHASTIASCDYNVTFSAAIRKDNFWGIQCHAEKSGEQGSQLLSNFVNGSLQF